MSVGFRHMPLRPTFVLLALLLAGQQSAQILQVTPLPRDGEVLVSFKLDEAMTDDIKAAIQSGLTVKFSYHVRLVRPQDLVRRRRREREVRQSPAPLQRHAYARRPHGVGRHHAEGRRGLAL